MDDATRERLSDVTETLVETFYETVARLEQIVNSIKAGCARYDVRTEAWRRSYLKFDLMQLKDVADSALQDLAGLSTLDLLRRGRHQEDKTECSTPEQTGLQTASDTAPSQELHTGSFGAS